MIDCREEFEKWYRSIGYESFIDKGVDAEGHYISPNARKDFEVWVASWDRLMELMRD